MQRIAVILLVAIFSGCAGKAPLESVSIKPKKTATVELQTGMATGSGGSRVMIEGQGFFVPVTTGPVLHLQFNEEDQLKFIELLEAELNSTGLLNVIKSSNALKVAPEVKISILFAQTHHNPHYQEYTLDVAMRIEEDGKSFTNKYHVISSEGDSWWTKMNTSAAQGKSKATTKLIKMIIPDINKWVVVNR